MNKLIYGYASAISGALIWGIVPLYYNLLNGYAFLEVVAQRIFWASTIFIFVFIIQKRFTEISTVLGSPKKLILFLVCSILISANWLFFIFAIQHGQLMQSALGYYIYPLLTAALGYYVLGERLENSTRIALIFAVAAVFIKGTALSNFPWIAISMAITFAAYAIIRKQLTVKPDTGLMIETTMLMPVALLYFGWQFKHGIPLFLGGDIIGLILAIFCGLFTVIPLYLFHSGNKVLPLSIAGLIFYLNPTSQMFISILLGENYNLIDISAFVLIWLGLVIQFSPMLLKLNRRKKKSLN